MTIEDDAGRQLGTGDTTGMEESTGNMMGSWWLRDKLLVSVEERGRVTELEMGRLKGDDAGRANGVLGARLRLVELGRVRGDDIGTAVSVELEMFREDGKSDKTVTGD